MKFFGLLNRHKKISTIIFVVTLYVYSNMVNGCVASGMPVDKYFVQTEFGKFNSVNSIVYWLINFAKYLGWVGVLVGVFATLALLIYKLIFASDQETMKKLQDGMIKTIIIIILGILLLFASFLLSITSDISGAKLPVDLNDVTN